ncbi:MAG: hypothetical protein VCG02_07230, partial [Verrucomicrobiota bacterium]
TIDSSETDALEVNSTRQFDDNTFQTVFDPNGNPIVEGTETTITSNHTESVAISNNEGRTITSTFQIAGGNAQYRLKGSWIENGGVVATVDAISEAAGGVIQTVASPAGN